MVSAYKQDSIFVACNSFAVLLLCESTVSNVLRINSKVIREAEA